MGPQAARQQLLNNAESMVDKTLIEDAIRKACKDLVSRATIGPFTQRVSRAYILYLNSLGYGVRPIDPSSHKVSVEIRW